MPRAMTTIRHLLLGATFAGLPAVAFAQDVDGDGVGDAADVFPCDPTRASVTWFPSASDSALLAFEDQWPGTTDLDYNDVAVRAHYRLERHASGAVTSLHASFDPEALGGVFSSGLALQLPTPRAGASARRRVAGGAWQALALEGDANATVVLSSNLRELFGGLDGRINSQPGVARVTGQRLELEVTFAAPVAMSVASAPFDVFVFRAGDLGHQVHFPQYGGTAAMNAALFGTGQDGSTSSRRFVFQGGLPAALNLMTTTRYPLEGVAVSALFPDIVTFASSGGTQATSFYTSNVVTAQGHDVAARTPPVMPAPDRTCIVCRAEVVDFEGLAEGTLASGLFASQGVTFTSSDPSRSPRIAVEGGSAYAFTGSAADTPMPSGSGGLVLHPRERPFADLVLTFASPVSDLRFYIVDIDEGDSFTADAYAGASLLGSVTRTAGQAETGNGYASAFLFPYAGITQVVVRLSAPSSQTSIGWALDFLTYTRCGAVEGPVTQPPRFELMQESAPGVGDFEQNVLGTLGVFQSSAGLGSLYAYDVPHGSSYNGTLVSVVAERSHLWLAETANGLSLFVVHDRPTNASGGTARMRFELVGASGPSVAVQDDPLASEVAGGGAAVSAGSVTTGALRPEVDASTTVAGHVLTSNHGWSTCCTDGFAAGGLTGLTALVGQFTHAPTGLDAWHVYLGDRDVSVPLSMTVGRRMLLRRLP